MTKPSDTLARLRARSVEAGRFVLALDPVWSDKLSQAYNDLRLAELANGTNPDADLSELRAVVADLEDKAGENVMVFRFRRMTKPEWEQLIAAHPLNAEQRDRQKNLPEYQRKPWNEETLEPDLLARLCIEPRLTVEEATEILRGSNEDGAPFLSAGESSQLINAAVAAATSIIRAPQGLKLP